MGTGLCWMFVQFSTGLILLYCQESWTAFTIPSVCFFRVLCILHTTMYFAIPSTSLFHTNVIFPYLTGGIHARGPLSSKCEQSTIANSSSKQWTVGNDSFIKQLSTMTHSSSNVSQSTMTLIVAAVYTDSYRLELTYTLINKKSSNSSRISGAKWWLVHHSPSYINTAKHLWKLWLSFKILLVLNFKSESYAMVTAMKTLMQT